MIIDFHVHPFVQQEENLCMYKESMDFSDGFFKQDIEAAGIDRICGSVIRMLGKERVTDFEPFRQMNREAIMLAKQWEGFYTPGIHVSPDFVKESCEEMESMKAEGVKLVGELVPYAHGWSDYSCKEFSEILDTAGQLELVVNFHSMDPDQMEKMVAAHPNVTFVAAHPGQKGDFLSHLERMRKYRNLSLDLSGTGLFRYGMLKYGVEQLGAERFLFGTDYPICNPGMYVQAVKHEHIPEEAKELIFHGNAERILGL